MARPTKPGIEYFPLDVGFLQDIKTRVIMNAYGGIAASILISLLCNIYKDEGYYIRFTDELVLVVAVEIGTKECTVTDVINKAVKVGFFDENIFTTYGILTSKGIQERYISAVSRRKEVFLRRDIALININVDNNPVNVCNNPVNVCNNPQSKVKESKGKESKKRDRTTTTKFTKPTPEELYAYCKEKGYTFGIGAFLDYYESNGWRVGRNPMKSWKAACGTWQRKEKEWKQPEEKKKFNLPDYYGMQGGGNNGNGK